MRAHHAFAAAVTIIATSIGSAGSAQTEQRVWTMHGTDPLVLMHTVRETDDRDFFATCRPHRGTIDVILTRTIAGLKRHPRIEIVLAAGSWRQRSLATTTMDDESDAFVPVITVAPGGGLLRSMARERALRITIGKNAPYVVSLAGSAATVRAFAAACGSGA